jgi:hypothetical protein
MKRTATARSRTLGFGVVLGALALGACRGENLFTGAGTLAGTEPQILITAPGSGSTIAVGDSILILAEITAQEGLSTVSFRGEYADSAGGDAYTPETQSGNGLTFLRVSNRLRAVPGQVAGDVYIVIEATDAVGGQGKDSVKVSVVN